MTGLEADVAFGVCAGVVATVMTVAWWQARRDRACRAARTPLRPLRRSIEHRGYWP